MLAVIVVVPAEAPVTANVAVVAPAAIVAVAGIVTTPAALLAKLTTRPPTGAGADSVSVRFCGVPPTRVRVAGERLSVAPTFTAWLSLVYPPVPLAVIVEDPKLMPVT